MKYKDNILMLGFLGVLAYDVLGSLSSRIFNFDYSYLTPISIVIYCAVGFFGTKEKGLKKGIWYTTQMGLFDSTIGWILAISLGANTGNLDIQPYSATIFIFVVIALTAVTSLIGLISGVVALMLKRD